MESFQCLVFSTHFVLASSNSVYMCDGVVHCGSSNCRSTILQTLVEPTGELSGGLLSVSLLWKPEPEDSFVHIRGQSCPAACSGLKLAGEELKRMWRSAWISHDLNTTGKQKIPKKKEFFIWSCFRFLPSIFVWYFTYLLNYKGIVVLFFCSLQYLYKSCDCFSCPRFVA